MHPGAWKIPVVKTFPELTPAMSTVGAVLWTDAAEAQRAARDCANATVPIVCVTMSPVPGVEATKIKRLTVQILSEGDSTPTIKYVLQCSTVDCWPDTIGPSLPINVTNVKVKMLVLQRVVQRTLL